MAKKRAAVKKKKPVKKAAPRKKVVAKKKSEVNITLDERNINRHPERARKAVRDSISQLGAGRSIVVDKTGRIIAGENTFNQATNLNMPIKVVESDGKTLVVVQRTDLDPDPRRRALAIADNKTGQLSEFDLSAASIELKEIAATLDGLNGSLDIDLGVTGFSNLELNSLLRDEPGADLEEFDAQLDKADELRQKWATQPGQLWAIGPHKLLIGDSTKAEDVKRLMGGESADMVVTDPPYNVNYQGAAGSIDNDNLGDEFRAFLTDAFSAMFASMKAGASFYIWHADSESYDFRGAVIDCDQQIRQCLIWKKNSAPMSRQDYHWIHEPCLYGWKAGAAHTWHADRKQTTVLNYDRPTRSEEHPTMKPVELIAYLICNSSRKGELVLDSFLGSGTTMVAAEQLGRRCFGLELAPNYAAVILQRMTDAGCKCDLQE